MANSLYNETLNILIATLAIIAFIFSTAEYVAFAEEPYIDGKTITKEDIKSNFYHIYIKPALFLIAIFFLYLINKNYIYNKKIMIAFTKWVSIFVTFVYVGAYIQATYHIGWLGPFFYYSTIHEGTIYSIRLGSIAYFLIEATILLFIVLSLLNLYGKVRNLFKES